MCTKNVFYYSCNFFSIIYKELDDEAASINERPAVRLNLTKYCDDLHHYLINDSAHFLLCVQGRWPVAYVERNLGSELLPKTEMIRYLQEHSEESFLRQWKLTGTNKSLKKTRNVTQLVEAYKVQ